MKKDNTCDMDLARASHASVAERVREAAEESLEVAKKTRARVRRQRMTSNPGYMQAVRPLPPGDTPLPPPLEMPDEWREDEDTTKIIVEKP